ncbi:MAG: NfeD family protein [Alphaproteobacteria bacterium HGW-Alphaproteobacteria-18]|nr:MAG: NfeD family protein [Alphaproteobacteria bacterium HGW-Alphaproteobacteria-18]
MEFLLTEMTWWHWVAIALVLFGIEMMTGTFDLLMISIAAVGTALFAGLAPDGVAGWQGQLVVFGIAAIILVAGGRMFLSRRGPPPEHPTLNKRMAGLVGQHGQATRDFTAGSGQVKIGDTVWGAEAVPGELPILAGDTIIVSDTSSNMAIVRKA